MNADVQVFEFLVSVILSIALGVNLLGHMVIVFISVNKIIGI